MQLAGPFYKKYTVEHLVLPLFVNIGFQVLFHSPPGVLFTVPSQYFALSVTREYLALGGGPPVFPQGFSCPVVLWILLALLKFCLRDFHPLWCAFPKHFHYFVRYRMQSLPQCCALVWALSRSLAAT
jgi:hypothetical protein